MATFTPARTPDTFVRGSKALTQFEGNEGQILSKKIAEVIHWVNSEWVQRLIQPLERENEKNQDELRTYLDSFQVDNNADVAATNYFWQVWQQLSEYFINRGFCLEVPDACPGENNDFMYTWSKAEHYLECEIFATGEVEFFYRNRKTGVVWGEDTTLEQGFSSTILEKAALFAWSSSNLVVVKV
jgi:hypothetical protein